ISAASWPHHDKGWGGGSAGLFARVPKRVASRGTPVLSWAASEGMDARLVGRRTYGIFAGYAPHQ
ncbi:hypothetical protein VM98_38650, partial [Streptomyces rubellomurinus subsp. indigoferus]